MLTNQDKGGYFYKPYLRAQNIFWESVDLRSLKKMWFSKEELKKLRLYQGDLLVSEGGEVGRTAIWNNEIDECFIQNSVHKITFNKNHLSRYYLYLFEFYGKIGYFESIVNRVSIAHLTREKLKEIFCITPSFEEQKQIVSYLDQKTSEIDTLITDKEKKVELLQEYRQAIISEAVTKGLDPNVEMKDSGIEWIGEIPKHWEIIRLKFLTKKPFKYGANEASNIDNPTFPRYIRITDLDEYGNLRDDTFCSLPFEKAKFYMLKDGDVLLARSGATVGKSFLYAGEYGPSCYAGYLIKFEADREKLIPNFLFYYTLSNGYKKWIEMILIQATIQNVSAEKYKNLWIPTPILEDQETIIKFLDQKTNEIEKFILNIQNQIQELNNYRQALISEAVTGKIDVRNHNKI